MAQVGSRFDTEATLQVIAEACQECRDQGAELVVFPEALLGGYPKGLTFQRGRACPLCWNRRRNPSFRSLLAEIEAYPGPKAAYRAHSQIERGTVGRRRRARGGNIGDANNTV